MELRRQSNPPPPGALSEGAARVVEAMSTYASDPFQGAIQRHVMSDGMTSHDMEELAARDALSRSGIGFDEVDLLLTYTAVPEHLVNNSACVLHGRLGLSRRCFVLQVEATAFSFLAQLTLAEQMIKAGRARRALLVQSCGISRIVDNDDFIAPLFGDGATAVVVGAVTSPSGIIGSVCRTDTSYPFTLVGGVRTGTWYDDGPAVLHSLDLPGARDMFLSIADQGREVIGAALELTKHTPSEIDFFACHQGTVWIRRVVQAFVGLDAARSIDSFPTVGSLFASNIPLVLRHAEDANLIAPGNLVLMFGGGTGSTYGSTLVRWGN
jgi:3-oxoacyl-[acyl-carrier-protein] synthase-3